MAYDSLRGTSGNGSLLAWKSLRSKGQAFWGPIWWTRYWRKAISVVAVDNLVTGSMENLKHLRKEPRLELLQWDVCELFDVGHVDYIFHFASPASPPDYWQHGPETLRVNSVGTFNAISLARKYHATLFLASTPECYGDPLEHLWTAYRDK